MSGCPTFIRCVEQEHLMYLYFFLHKHTASEKAVEQERSMYLNVSFILVSALQNAFLNSKITKELLGYDFTKEEERASYIRKLVAIIFNGSRKEVFL